MIYKGQKDIKILIVESCQYTIIDEISLEDTVKRNLNSVDYDIIIEEKGEIEIIEFNIINDNNNKSYASSTGDMFYSKIYQIFYKINLNTKDRKEI
jgi:hypothetical protein